MMNQEPREVEQKQQNNDESQYKGVNPVRFVYNVTPATRQAAFSAAIPNAVHYTPFLADLDPDVIVQTKGIICQKCRSYLNLYCQIMESKKLWVCCICKQPNSLPQNIPKSIVNNETFDKYSETKQKKEQVKQKLYLFVIDLCISQKQMKSIINSLIEFVNFKATQQYEGVTFVNRIGIITFSKFVYCYELSSALNTVICISAENYYETQNVLKFLSLKPQNNKQAADKYFANAKTATHKLQRRIRKLKAEGCVQNEDDPIKRCRAKRSYGQALNVALSLCQSLNKQCRVISLVGGPCTYGVGTTIGIDFRQQMRSIKQLQSGENIHYFQSSSQYYQMLKKKIQAKKTVLDLFLFSVEQTGLTQLYSLIKLSGGLLVLGEQFSGQLKIFQFSFRKAFVQTEQNEMVCSLVSSCVMSVSCSSDIKINGALGCCKPLESVMAKQFVSDKPIGFGDTNLWYIGGMDCYKTMTFMYQLAASKAFDLSYFIQFRTAYKDYWGFNKVRVTTVKRIWDTNTAIVSQNFDQEAAIVALARWYLYRQSFQPKANFRQWLDKLLVRWTTNFANFIKGDCSSFSLPQKMKFLPQFIYHFRRNPLIRRTGLSLDELTYHSHRLNIETVEHSLTIIQPALLSYTIQKPFPSPVRLEEQQMKNSVILLLDTYFHVLLWYGQNIEYWQKQKFHKQKQYQHVKTLLEAPHQDITYLLNSRFPYPGFYLTNSGHSKERILKSKISPKASDIQSQNMLTDDKSVHIFMKALIEIIVNGKTSLS